MQTIAEILNERAALLISLHSQENVYRILIDGKFVTMPSGKTSWKTIGHAKNALHYAMKSTKYKMRHALSEKYSDLSHADVNAMMKELYDTFVKERVEFRRV